LVKFIIAYLNGVAGDYLASRIGYRIKIFLKKQMVKIMNNDPKAKAAMPIVSGGHHKYRVCVTSSYT
jgi:hypothetical protein